MLAHVLTGGGHLPGTAPSVEAVRLATDPAVPEGRSPETVQGAFELLGADGRIIWNEGLPADIPAVDGHRVLVLDTPRWSRERRPLLPDAPGHRRTPPRPARRRYPRPARPDVPARGRRRRFLSATASWYRERGSRVPDLVETRRAALARVAEPLEQAEGEGERVGEQD